MTSRPLLAIAAFAITLATVGEAAAAELRVLVYSRTLGFRHDSIEAGVAALQQLATDGSLGAVDATEDPTWFTPEGLAGYDVIVFLSPSGDILDTDQRAAFQAYVEAGGGWVGIHNASAYVLEDWDWYTQLVGARYESEIATQPMLLVREVDDHPSTLGLPGTWATTMEAYNVTPNPADLGLDVLVTLDENSVSGGTMGDVHPFTWCHAYAGGRAWYTMGGANVVDFADPVFIGHVRGGIEWAAGAEAPPTTSSGGSDEAGGADTSGSGSADDAAPGSTGASDPSTSTSAPATTTAAADDGGSGDTTAAAPADDGSDPTGCGCTSTPRRAHGFPLALLVGAAWRRRRGRR